MEQFFVNDAGAFLGVFVDGAEPPEGAIEVATAPGDGRQLWDFVMEEWMPLAGKYKIPELEALITPRRLREAVATPDMVVDTATGETASEWLERVNAEIAEARTQH